MSADVSHGVEREQPTCKYRLVNSKGLGDLFADVLMAPSMEREQRTERHDLSCHPDRKKVVRIGVLRREVLDERILAATLFHGLLLNEIVSLG